MKKNVASTIAKVEIRQAIEGIIDSFNAARDAGKSPERLTAEIIGGFLFRASEEGNGVLYYNPIQTVDKVQSTVN